MGVDTFQKHRAVWILVAASLFVTIIVCSGLWVFYPRAQEQNSVAAQTGVDHHGLLLADLHDIGHEHEHHDNGHAEHAEHETDIAVVQEEKVAVQDTTPTHVSDTPSEKTVVIHSQRNGAQKVTLSAVAEPSPTVATAPALPSTLYWIQLFSSTNYEHAMQAKRRLAQNQIDGLIVTHEVDNLRYYRLRVGPYYKAQEAEKFLQWFNQGVMFNDGYVVQTSVRR